MNSKYLRNRTCIISIWQYSNITLYVWCNTTLHDSIRRSYVPFLLVSLESGNRRLIRRRNTTRCSDCVNWGITETKLEKRARFVRCPYCVKAQRTGFSNFSQSSLVIEQAKIFKTGMQIQSGRTSHGGGVLFGPSAFSDSSSRQRSRNAIKFRRMVTVNPTGEISLVCENPGEKDCETQISDRVRKVWFYFCDWKQMCSFG